ncbi:hypothetical protein [Algicella marina]|uniref:Uncharacterized protein n=1 Tax=Algicella marina TaxID=2683284 RepID=A0A6P1SW02_9RHOB|nr:hypothetical protein [Algicella marina]QHQ34628.1 hypothetical protein GO499_05190 [Algicella marina]
MRGLRLLRVCAVAVGLVPSAALALSPLPPCAWDAEAQAFADEGAGVFVLAEANGFASGAFTAPDGRQWGLLHHCPTDKYLLFVTEEADHDAVWERFRALLETSVPVTMPEIGVDLALLGAGVRRGQGDIGNCDCEHLGLVK